MKKIITNHWWSCSTIRRMCIHENFYTRGDNKAYSSILNFVGENKPTGENIYIVAKDIAEHSSWDDDSWTEEEKIENVAFCIVTEAIGVYCEIA